MAATIPVKIYEILEDKLGRDEAKEVVKELEDAVNAIILQKKTEVKEELSRELASKADIARLEGKIEAIKIDLERKLKLYFIMLIFVIILVSPRAIDLLAKLLGVIK
ncbi:hypothetical protein [Dissulfurispira thermophila]|nr:hypothetical protein [Dissulfurispira thermophila]